MTKIESIHDQLEMVEKMVLGTLLKDENLHDTTRGRLHCIHTGLLLLLEEIYELNKSVDSAISERESITAFYKRKYEELKKNKKDEQTNS